ncbi:MAG: hypothetical protein ABI395_03520 [Sphingobium sp.]
MNRFSQFRTAAMIAFVALASCVGPPAAPPPAPPQPPPVVQAPPPPPLSADWRNWPVSAGDWSYRKNAEGSVASFGIAGSAALLSMRCALTTRQIVIARFIGATSTQGAGQMTLRTSFGAVQWPFVVNPATGSTALYATATRAAGDAALDQMAFSRGRIALEIAGMPPLVVPNWAEVTRVIEDCRG